MKNLNNSIWTLREEGYYPVELKWYHASMRDNFTDSIMLSKAMYYDNSKSPLDKAIHVYNKSYPSAEGDKYKNILFQIRNDYDWEEIEHTPYSRYWHGYLVFLRPLLQFFSYEEIRGLSCALQIILTLLIAYWISLNKAPMLLLAFFSYVFLTSPTGAVSSMQFMAVHFITCLSILGILIHKKKYGGGIHQLEQYAYIFLFLGIFTSYFDLLTAPIITFGIPFLTAASLDENSDVKKILKQLIVCGTMWVIGYLGFWFMKWLLGSLLSGENLFLEAFGKVASRASLTSSGGIAARMKAIEQNMEGVKHPSYYVLFAAALLLGTWRCVKYRADGKKMLKNRWPLLLMACVPFAWWFVTANHATIHWWFTHRSICITTFAVLVWFGSVPKESPVQKNSQ